MTERREIKEFNSKAVDSNPPPSSASTLSFDAVAFMHFLEETDWSEEEKAEYLVLIWEIVCEFVALGFDVHPIQQARKACGKPCEPDVIMPSGTTGMVDSGYGELIEKFSSLTDAECTSGEEGAADE